MGRLRRLLAAVFTMTAVAIACFGTATSTYAEMPAGHIGSQRVTQVELGHEHTAAITEDGCLWLWGSNTQGQLGDDAGVRQQAQTEPVKIMDGVKSVALGGTHSAAIKIDGSLWMWGGNYDGCLGDGTVMQRDAPVKIMENVIAVSLGSWHSAAITEDGSLWTWGTNSAGALGDGTTERHLTPVKIMDGVAAVSLGKYSSAAITQDGSLYTWGDNSYGQLGNGTIERSLNPTKIMDNVASVSVGGYHSVAVKQDGSLWAWGSNSSSQLGDGTVEDRLSPIRVMEGVASAAAGGGHTAAIKADGSLWSWGSSQYGQIGNNSTYPTLEMSKIMDGVTGVSLGQYHSAAISEDGSLWTWGLNENGQLGDGTTENRYEPVKITLGDGGTTTIPGQITHFYGATQVKDPKGQIKTLTKNFNTAMDDYLDVIRDAAEDDSKTLLRQANKKTKGQMLREMDLATDAKILSLVETAPEDAIAAAYEATAFYLDEYVNEAKELGAIDMSGHIVEIDADVVNEIRNNVRLDNLTVRSGEYTVTFKVTGFLFAYFGDVTVKGSGRTTYEGGIVSSPGDTAAALNSYVERLADWTEDALYQAMNSISSDFGKVTGISDFTDKMVREYLEDKVDVLRQRGFGDLLAFCQAMRNGYEIVEPLLDDSEEGFSDALEDAIYIYNKIEDIDYSDSAVTNKTVSTAMNKVNSAKKSLVTALHNYLYETEEGQNSYSGWDEFWANPGDAIMSWFKCPVDVTVYAADGSVLGRIEGNRVASCSEGIYLKTEGDMKGVAVPDGTDARIVATATDSGSMTVMVEQYEDGAPNGRAVYREVPLTDGGSYTLEFPAGGMSASSMPSLAPDGGDSVSGKFVSADDESANVSISAVATAGGECSGSGTYPIGEPVALTARPQDGYSFSGWYKDGTLVGFGTTYCLSALEDTSVEARFELVRTVDESIRITLAEPYGDAGAWAYEAGGSLNDLVISMAGIEGIDGPDYALRFYDDSGDLVAENQKTAASDGSWRREIEGIDLKGYGTVEVLTTDGKLILTVGSVLTHEDPDDPDTPTDPDVPVTPDPDEPDHDATCPSKEFSDVDTTQWYHAAVDWALEAGAMNGYENGTFGPVDPLTREQAAAVLWNLLGDKDVSAPAAGHADVDQGAWYADAVNWAVEHGYMNGYGNSDRFGVGDALTREQFACVVANVAEADLDEADPSAMEKLPDAGEVSSWAEAAVAWAVQEGVINGVETEGGRELQPGRTISRAEMAAMMMNAVDKGALEIE